MSDYEEKSNIPEIQTAASSSDARILEPGTPYAASSDKHPKKKKSFRRGVITGVFTTLVAVAVIVGILFVTLADSFSIDGLNMTKLRTLAALIDEYYYKDVDDDALATGIYKGLLEGLDDPYSVYYTADEYKDLQASTSGTIVGIGATLQKDTETGEVKVTAVYEDSPAKKAGIVAGDKIISADGYLGTDEDLDVFVQRIRGEEDTTVEIVYEHEGEEQTVIITRAQIEIASVSYQMLDNQIGYIQIDEFSENTEEQFLAAIDDLESQGMQAVIYDLRFNGGGLVTSVTSILDDILPEGTTVYMEDKNGERQTYTSDAENFLDYPTVVLTSDNTASAAEIFAGAVRDFDYGTLIGTKTFGKGIVQTNIPLTDGSAVKITMATYYTPSGECIHEKGITPDVELAYEFLGGDDDSYDVTFDNQIQKGVEVLMEELE